MTNFSPATDKTIERSYGAQTLEYKVQNKVVLQEKLGWPAEPKRALVCIPAGVSDQLGGKLLEEVLPGLLELPIQILILGKGSASYGKMLTDIAQKHAHRIAIVPNDDKNIRAMYAASDMALFLSNPAALPELNHSLAYGCIPVAPSVSKLADYNPNQESGEAFTYEKDTVWHCFAAMVRALETFKFPYDWKTIQRHCMELSERR
jgi:starch synthase